MCNVQILRTYCKLGLSGKKLDKRTVCRLQLSRHDGVYPLQRWLGGAPQPKWRLPCLVAFGCLSAGAASRVFLPESFRCFTCLTFATGQVTLGSPGFCWTLSAACARIVAVVSAHDFGWTPPGQIAIRGRFVLQPARAAD